MVLLLHLQIIFGWKTEAFSRGYLAVDFFFMLSGYVMARTYEAGGMTGRKFLWMRYRRLWPAMAVGAAISALCLLVSGISALAIVLILAPLALMLPNPLTHGGRGDFPVNLPAWSIFCELVANWLHGLVLWRMKTAHLLMIAAVVLAVMQYYSPGLFTGQRFGLLKGLSRVVVAYSIGIALFRVGWRALPPWLGLVLPVSILLLAGTPGYMDLLFLALCPVVILSGTGAFASRFAELAGALSFPLYAVHTPVIHLVKYAGGNAGLAVSLTLVVALLVATLIDRRLSWPDRDRIRTP